MAHSVTTVASAGARPAGCLARGGRGFPCPDPGWSKITLGRRCRRDPPFSRLPGKPRSNLVRRRAWESPLLEGAGTDPSATRESPTINGNDTAG
jgi:hypothetical protein